MTRGWWLPCCISALLHAAVLLPLTLISTPASSTSGQPLELQAILLEEDPRPSPKVVPAPVMNVEVVSAPPSIGKSTAPVVEPLPSFLTPAGPIRPVAFVEPTTTSGSAGHGSGAGSDFRSASAPALFVSAPRARSVVYVIDRSVSMGLNGALEQVKGELLASLARLPGEARFQIIVYNRSAQPLILGGAIGMACATPANRAAVARQLASLTAEGATEHLPALSLALSYDAEVVYFLTDADDLRPEQVRQVTQMNRGRAVIHTIELTTANAQRLDMPLQTLARENRGTYHAVALR